MPNQEATEPDNALAQAMRDLGAVRGTNSVLRSSVVEAPPLDDADFIEDFRRTTGYIINSAGSIVGRDPNWVGPEPAPASGAKPLPLPHEGQEPQPPSHPHPQEAPVFGHSPGKIRRGIDLDAAVAIVDGTPFKLSPEEVANVANFIISVMTRGLQAEYGLVPPAPPKEEMEEKEVVKEDDNVPAVPSGEEAGRVPYTPRKKGRAE